MSSDDDSPRKTLSLTKKPRATSAADRHDAPSKRSGARARAVALAARQNPERDEAQNDSRGPARRDGPRASDGPRTGYKPRTSEGQRDAPPVAPDASPASLDPPPIGRAIQGWPAT